MGVEIAADSRKSRMAVYRDDSVTQESHISREELQDAMH